MNTKPPQLVKALFLIGEEKLESESATFTHAQYNQIREWEAQLACYPKHKSDPL